MIILFVLTGYNKIKTNAEYPVFLSGSVLLFLVFFWPIMCLYVLSSVLCCQLRFPHIKNDVWLVFTSSCL